VAHVSPAGNLYLIASDQERVYLSFGEPSNADFWTWIDECHHLDPHGLAVTPDFERESDFGVGPGPTGKLLAVNDGGSYVSVDGGRTWSHGAGLATLNVVNISIGARAGKPPAICFGSGDNNGFYTSDGGASWKNARVCGRG
jgi:hypothetical protein